MGQKERARGPAPRFVLAVLKIAAGVTLSAVVLGFGIWGIVVYMERAELRATADIRTPREWPELTIDVLDGPKMSLRGVWRDRYAHLQLSIDGYTDPIRSAVEIGQYARFNLQLRDKDGFLVHEQQVPLSDMTGSVGASGERVGLTWEDEVYLSEEDYRAAENWNVTFLGISPIQR